ncbi:MAG: HEAT repeat domain-containing protein [Planctomycetes bacterium]|nr:HEAT repeat domain-containing protein [Planctomycetota bacterium]
MKSTHPYRVLAVLLVVAWGAGAPSRVRAHGGGDPMPPPQPVAPVFLTPGQEPPADAPEPAEAPGPEGVGEWRERLLQGGSDSVRALAAYDLLRSPEAAAADALREALASPDDRVVEAVCAAIRAQRDERFLPQLLALLAGDREKLVPALVDCLGALRGVVPHLALALRTPDLPLPVAVRMIMVLGRSHSREAVEPLLALLDHPDPTARAEVAGALYQITRRRFVDPAAWSAWWTQNKGRPREVWLDSAFDDLDRAREASGAESAKKDAAIRDLKLRVLQLTLEPARKEANDKAVAAALIGFLEAPEYRDIRRGVLEEIGKLGKEKSKEAVPVLVRLLSEPDTDSVVAVAATLGSVGDERAVAGLAGLLGHENATVRKEALLALCKLGGPEAERGLTAALGDRDPVVLLAALDCVKRVRPAAAVRPLRDLMRGSANPEVVLRAVEALGELGDSSCTADLLLFLQAAHLRKDRKALWSAANSLGKLADPAALAPLIALLDEEFSDVRQSAVEALGNLRMAGAVEPLRIALRTDKDPRVRELAARGIARVAGPESIEPLVAALGDAEPQVGAAAWEAIKLLIKGDAAQMDAVAAQLGAAGRAPQEIEILTALLADPDFAAPANAARRLAAQRRLAACLVEAKQWKEALPLLEAAEKSAPEDALLKEHLALCARELGDFDRARELLAWLLGREEKGSVSWWSRQLALSTLRVKRKEYAPALKELTEFLAQESTPDALRIELSALADLCRDGLSHEEAQQDKVKTRVEEILGVYATVDAAQQKRYEEELHQFGRDAAAPLLGVLRSTARRSAWPAAAALLSSLTGITAKVPSDAAPADVEKAVRPWQDWLGKS